MRPAAVLAFAVLSPVALSAQWPAYLGSDVPRAADGSPDLNAPAPRLANGKPDFSGVWESRVPPSGRLGGRMLPSIGEAPPLAAFVDVGVNMKGGLPFTPWAAELRKQRMTAQSKDNPDAHCLPLGFMQLHTHSQPRKIVHATDDIVIMYEANYGLRQIFTDGRTLPGNDPQPWWDGYSVGRWDGDTLVVESTGFRDDGWLYVNGSPFTSSTRLTERFRRVNYGRLEVELTIDDPKAYTRPWSVTLNQVIVLDTDLLDYHCLDNEKDAAHLVGR